MLLLSILMVIDSLLNVLDMEVGRADRYFAIREQRIMQARLMLASQPTNAEAAYALAELYAPYICDSSLRYAEMAVRLSGDDVPEEYSTILDYEQQVVLQKGGARYICHPERINVEGTHEHAIACYTMAMIARDAGDSLTFVENLVRSAISDVRCGASDNGSSWALAMVLAEHGDLDRAYRYIDYSMSNMMMFNSAMRYTEIIPVASVIRALWAQEQRRVKYHMIWGLGLVGILALLITIFSLRMVRQNRKLASLNRDLRSLNVRLQSLNRELTDSNRVKEQYICRYLELYSDTIHRLTKMTRRLGDRDAETFMAKEMEQFYHSFDQTFLALYGDFVPQFNALIREEDGIWPKHDELLTTELRIYALIRLGIDSSAKIAELLCYSPNTIYNYRARVKKTALGDRETFEDRVRMIGA